MADFSEERRAGVWPRVYRPGRSLRIFYYVLAAIAFAGALGLFGVALFHGKEMTARVIVLLSVCGLGCVAGGVYLIVWAKYRRVLLDQGVIELVDPGYGRRRLRRDEIAGLRVIPLKYGFRQIVFELSDPARKPVKTDLHVEHDEVLLDWLRAIVDLDAQDRTRALEELLQRSELGHTEEERRRVLVAAHSRVRVADLLTWVVSAWGFVYPWPYTAAMGALAAIPFAALALLWAGRGRYAVFSHRNEVRPALTVPLLVPSFVLGLRALSDFQMIDWRAPLLWAVIGALCLTALAAAADPALRRLWYAPLGPALAFCGYSSAVLLMANVLFDHGAPEVFRAAVLGKSIHARGGPHYHLELAPWGPDAGGSAVVSRRLYQDEAAKVGGTVCVHLRPGALGYRWYRVLSCDESDAR